MYLVKLSVTYRTNVSWIETAYGVPVSVHKWPTLDYQGVIWYSTRHITDISLEIKCIVSVSDPYLNTWVSTGIWHADSNCAKPEGWLHKVLPEVDVPTHSMTCYPSESWDPETLASPKSGNQWCSIDIKLPVRYLTSITSAETIVQYYTINHSPLWAILIYCKFDGPTAVWHT